MWFERFVIIVVSLHRDFLPGSWGTFVPTWVDLGMLAGSFGLFFTLFLLFCRFLPVVAMAEVKSIMPQAHAHSHPSGKSTYDEARFDYNPDEPRRTAKGKPLDGHH
jgi:molybdopterin-containing oxidoreductase family membrane subunit